MIFCMKKKIKVFYKLLISFLLAVGRYAQSTQNSKFVITFKISKKKGGMKFIFCMQINVKLSYRLILLILVGMARHAQIT